MSKRIKYLAALAFLPLSLSAGSANAALGSYTGLCGAEFTQVYSEIEQANFLSKKNADWNRSSLVVKLDSAEGKLADSRFGDAIDYLQEISDKATGWADLGDKSKLQDPNGINTSVSAAIGCVTSLVR